MEYKYGERVEISAYDLRQSEDPLKIIYGNVVGKTNSFSDYWLVEMDEFPIGWEFKVIQIPPSLMRKHGSTEEFLCRKLVRS